MSNFLSYSKYYDLLYKDKNYKAEAEYISRVIQKYRPGSRELLELGCGSGGHASHLCQNGYKVTGLDRSREMIKVANEKKIKNFIPMFGDITGFSIDYKFDCAIAMFHVISYIVENKNLINCLTLTRKHLKPDGIFIFDVWYSPAVYHCKPENRIKRMADDDVSITRFAQPEILYNKNAINVSYDIFVYNKKNQNTDIINEQHLMRHFSMPEIELLALHTDFKILAHEEYITGKEADKTTWGVYFILQSSKNHIVTER